LPIQGLAPVGALSSGVRVPLKMSREAITNPPSFFFSVLIVQTAFVFAFVAIF